MYAIIETGGKQVRVQEGDIVFIEKLNVEADETVNFDKVVAVGTDNGFVILEKRNFNAQKHYLWPIPQKDRDINKNLDQNPNWN